MIRLEALLALACAALVFQIFPSLWAGAIGVIRVWAWPQWGYFVGTLVGLATLLFVRGAMRVDIGWNGSIKRVGDKTSQLASETPAEQLEEPDVTQEDAAESPNFYQRVIQADIESIERAYSWIRSVMAIWLAITAIDLLIAHFSYVTWVADLRNWPSEAWLTLTIVCLAGLAAVRFGPDVYEVWERHLEKVAERKEKEQMKKEIQERKKRKQEFQDRYNKQIRHF